MPAHDMSRFNDRDSRYPPRDDRRTSGPYNSTFNSRTSDFNRSYSNDRDPPRGPRGLNDTPSRPAPTAPRGRGAFAARGDYRDNRDSRDPPFGNDRWRDGDDRRERRISPRARSPQRARPDPRDRRDSRDFGKTIDTDRARPTSRDGPLSASSTLSDQARGLGQSFRGGFSGRGRGNDFRDRGRFSDERNSFRPRSRSRGPRRERDRSIDSRDFDMRGARDNDERRYRDRDERDSYSRRGDLITRTDSRAEGGARSATESLTTQNERPPLAHATQPDRMAGDFRREQDTSRRSSILFDVYSNRDARRDGDGPEPIVGRSEAQRVVRAASPPPAAPVVPSFGFRTSSHATGVTSLSWKNPDLQKPVPAAGTAQPPKAAPAAPKALSNMPPSAPKADRALEKSPSKESLNTPTEDNRKENTLQLGASPSPRLSTGTIPETQPRYSSSTSFLGAPSGAPSAPRAMTSPQPPFGRVGGPIGFGRAISPVTANVIPNGPKGSGSVNASPRMGSGSIPTGPRADRAGQQPPIGPRGGPVPMKLFRSNSQTFPRPSVVPSKRDVDGVERERSQGHESRPVEQAPQLSSASANGQQASSNHDTQPASSHSTRGIASIKKEANDPENRYADAIMTDVPSMQQTVSTVTDVQQKTFDHLMDDEDDDFDMVELATELEEKFMKEKARLETKRVDLSQSDYRPILLLDELSRLVAMHGMVPNLTFRTRAPVERKEDPIKIKEAVLGPLPLAIPTPQNDDDQIMEDTYSSRESSLERLSTPDPDSLPYLERGPPTPMSDSDPFSISSREFSEHEIKQLIQEKVDSEVSEEVRLRHEYRERYVAWRRQISHFDRQKEDAEQYLSQSSPETTVAMGPAELLLAPLATPTESGRRALRFASEYDIQKVLEMSLREEEEKKQKEQEAKEAQASATADREAVIPNMLSPSTIRQRTFEDVSQARRPEDALRIFEFAPAPDDFTEEEDRRMREVFRENIKAWGKIADIVGRTYKECINHYYASKWDRPYKTRLGGRKGKGSRPGGRKPGRVKSALVPADDAAEVDANGAPMVTESGRPRRAAAPTWGKDSDQDQVALTGSTGKKPKGEPSKEGEAGTEKVGRRKGTKEKVTKRQARNPPLAARPITSPQKVERDSKDKIVPTDIEEQWMPQTTTIVHPTEQVPPLITHQQVYAENAVVGYREVADLATANGTADQRARSHSSAAQRQGASSYWSVVEEQDFKKCLEYYGTDFQAISQHMGTKTHIMIKNHYQKFVNDGKHHELIQRAEEANRRRGRGEELGPPPTQSQAPKRHGRYDNPPATMPRSLAPNNDFMETESSTGMQGPPVTVGVSPPFGPRHVATSSITRPHATSVSSSSTHRPAGPVMGYFEKDTRQVPPPQLSQQPGQIRPLLPTEEPRTQRTLERIKTEFRAPDHDRDLHNQREADRQARIQAEKDAQAQNEVERREMYQRPLGHASKHSMQGIPAPEHYRPEIKQHQSPYQTPLMGPISHVARNVQSEPRHMIDLSAGLPATTMQPQLERRPPSPLRQSPANATPQQHLFNVPPSSNSAPPVATAPPNQAPRRSNLMSLLNNDEPEPEQTRRREPEPLPPQAFRITTSVNTESPVTSMPPRDTFGDRSYPRPSYPSTGQAPASSLSTPTNDPNIRDPLNHRDSWPGRQQSHQTGSPYSHVQHVPPQEAVRGPSLFGRADYRASAFGQLNHPARANPSPPPHAAYQHSRTPSYTHPQHAPPPTSLPAVSAPQHQNVHPNPYGPKDAHVAGPSPHLSAQQHPPLQGRSDMLYTQSQFEGRRVQEQHDAMYDRYRDPEYHTREQEARELQYQEKIAAQQQRFGHHTPPVNAGRYPPPMPPDRNAVTPLPHTGYPPLEAGHHPHAFAQRQYEYNQELARRNMERERVRAGRIEEEARQRQQKQQQVKQSQRVAYEEELRRQGPDDQQRYGVPPR